MQTQGQSIGAVGCQGNSCTTMNNGKAVTYTGANAFNAAISSGRAPQVTGQDCSSTGSDKRCKLTYNTGAVKYTINGQPATKEEYDTPPPTPSVGDQIKNFLSGF